MVNSPATELSSRPPLRTRPRNRRPPILAAAAALFAQKGYSSVAMADIAAAVAVRPSALYRHYRGKEELLYTVVHDALTSVESSIDRTDLRSIASVLLDHRELGLLWQRESRHLEPPARSRLRGELVAIEQVVAAMVSERRPDVSRRRCDLLAWSTMAAVMSVSFQRVRLPRTEYDELLANIIETIVDVRPPRGGGGAPGGTRPPAGPGRRAALLAAAARLFAARGYHSVTIDDIGAAVGIAGPSVYRHFPSKLDLMLAIMADGARQMNSDMARILAEQTGEAAVRSLLAAYSTYSLSNGDVIELLITETVHLPEPHRSTYLGVQRRYIDTWLRLLGDLDPSWPAGHARVRLPATFNLINDISRTAHLRVQAITAAAVQTMGYALLVPGAAAGPAEQSSGGIRAEAGDQRGRDVSS